MDPPWHAIAGFEMGSEVFKLLTPKKGPVVWVYIDDADLDWLCVGWFLSARLHRVEFDIISILRWLGISGPTHNLSPSLFQLRTALLEGRITTIIYM